MNPDVFKDVELYVPINLLKVLLVCCLFAYLGIDKSDYEGNFNDATID